MNMFNEGMFTDVATKMESLASYSAARTSIAGAATRRLIYYHPRFGIFFMEYLICTHTDCSRAMNFYHRIQHTENQLRNGISLKSNKVQPGTLTSSGQMKLLRFIGH